MEQDIIEGNKLIAEFMGLKYRFAEYPDSALNCWQVDKGNYETLMKYHSSWDWIMPVVEKIESIFIGGSSATLKIEGDMLQLWFGIDNGSIDFASGIYRGKGVKRKENLWLICVKFIQWYDNKKQTNGTETEQ